MARFTVQGNLFIHPVAQDEEEDAGQDLPTPQLLRANARRLAGIQEAHDVLACLPAPGESLHAIVTTRLDLSDVLGALLEKLGACERMAVATLSFNERNLRHLLAWLDAGAVASLTLLCSLFFRAHKRPLWEEARRDLRARGHRAACMHSHAKVVTMAFASGARLSLEGSANLCSSGSGREQFALVNSPELHDWHAAWIDEQASRGEEKAREELTGS